MGDHEDRLEQIRDELLLKFSDPDDPGLFERRKRLRVLFGKVDAARAAEFRDQLGERATKDELSKLFHRRLSTPTRRELLAILSKNALAQPPTLREPTEKPEPVPLSPSESLPIAAHEHFRVALRELAVKVSATSDDRVARYRCWFTKLAAGGDDRVVQWHRICPATSGAIGAAFILGPCDLTAGMPVDQAILEASILSIHDIEQANADLRFITHMRSAILFAREFTSDDVQLANFRTFHDDVVRTVDKLSVWGDSPIPLDGVSEAMPRAYVAIKDWIAARQRDPNSVYSCL